MPDHGFYIFARIGDQEQPIAHLENEAEATQVSRELAEDERLEPRPACRVVASGANARWLWWDHQAVKLGDEISSCQCEFDEITGVIPSREAMLSPETHPRIKLSPFARAMLVAEEWIEILRSVTPIPPSRPEQSNRVRVEEPTGWTRKTLIAEAGKAGAQCGETTFDNIRDAAGVTPSKKGAEGGKRLYTIAEVEAMISVVVAGTYRTKSKIVRAWSALLRGPNAQ